MLLGCHYFNEYFSFVPYLKWVHPMFLTSDAIFEQFHSLKKRWKY